MKTKFPLSWSPDGPAVNVEPLPDRRCIILSGDGHLEFRVLGAGMVEVRLQPREKPRWHAFDPAHDPDGSAQRAWEERAMKYGRWIGEPVVDYHARLSRMTRLGQPRFSEDEIEELILYFESHEHVPRPNGRA